MMIQTTRLMARAACSHRLKAAEVHSTRYRLASRWKQQSRKQSSAGSSDSLRKLYETAFQFLRAKGVSSEQLRKYRAEPQIHDHRQGPTTINFDTWTLLPPTSPFDEKGRFRIANADKEDLCVQLTRLVDSRAIELSDRIALVCEGCDSADYLGAIVPFIHQINPRSEVRVFLINGNIEKLTHAYRFVSALVGEGQVSCHIDDAFFSSLPQLRKYRKYQHIHLPFRLPIVDRYRAVHRYIANRTELLVEGDLVFGCFRLWDSRLDSSCVWVTKQKFNRKFNTENGYVEYY